MHARLALGVITLHMPHQYKGGGHIMVPVSIPAAKPQNPISTRRPTSYFLDANPPLTSSLHSASLRGFRDS